MAIEPADAHIEHFVGTLAQIAMSDRKTCSSFCEYTDNIGNKDSHMQTIGRNVIEGIQVGGINDG